MSKIGMRESDGEGQSRDGNAIHPSSFGFENFDVNGHQKRKTRKGQLHKNDDDDEKPESNKSFTCMQPGCPRTFTSRFKLARHILIHSEKRRFQCSWCGRGFHRKDHLKNHMLVHNPHKLMYTCRICEQTYCSLLSFKKHLPIHAAEAGDLECKLNEKVLADREGVHHLKLHTCSRTLQGPSKRKFPCGLCDRSFFTENDIERHLAGHFGEQDFVCQFCPQRFGRKDHLVRHTKKSHVRNSDINHNNNSSSNTSPPSNGPLQKYILPSPMPPVDNSYKNGSVIVPNPLPDIGGLRISPSAPTPVIENQALDHIKDEPYPVKKN